jgi:hypothetical protein
VATWFWAVVAAAVVVIIAIVVIVAVRARRRATLKRRFGPEYDRTVEDADSRRQAERELDERASRREKFQTRELEPEVRQRYAAAWRDTQSRFVDGPADAVQEADVLVTRVMRDCGYPVEGFNDRSDFVSVDHPHLAEDYREAHRIAVADTEGKVTTEDRRKAMVHFRSLFNALLGEDEIGDRRERRAG